MQVFEQQLSQIPEEIKNAWSSSFVFVMENGTKFWHFPARQWTEEQIQEYFLNRYQATSYFIDHPNYHVKQLTVENHPELFVIVPR